MISTGGRERFYWIRCRRIIQAMYMVVHSRRDQKLKHEEYWDSIEESENNEKIKYGGNTRFPKWTEVVPNPNQETSIGGRSSRRCYFCGVFIFISFFCFFLK